MKRLLSLLLALTLLSLPACGEGGLTLRPGSGRGESGVITPGEDGIALGYEGDTLRTKFFDMTVENPRTSAGYDGLTADEGYQFLAADLTLYNYTDYTQPIYDTDFEVVWDLDDDNAWACPEYDETAGAGGQTEFSVRSATQIPVESELGIHKSMTGVLLFQVPEDRKEFFIHFYEVWSEEGSGEPRYGDSFLVRFSA